MESMRVRLSTFKEDTLSMDKLSSFFSSTVHDLLENGQTGDSRLMQIHGHAVIEFIAANDSHLTPEALKQAVLNQAGAEARFHTCSASGMTIDELLEFLYSRGKVSLQEGRLILHRENVCKSE